VLEYQAEGFEAQQFGDSNQLVNVIIIEDHPHIWRTDELMQKLYMVSLH
jgi:hypothetical protein